MLPIEKVGDLAGKYWTGLGGYGMKDYWEFLVALVMLVGIAVYFLVRGYLGG